MGRTSDSQARPLTPKAFPSNTANEIWKHKAGILHPRPQQDTPNHKPSVGDRDVQPPPSSSTLSSLGGISSMSLADCPPVFSHPVPVSLTSLKSTNSSLSATLSGSATESEHSGHQDTLSSHTFQFSCCCQMPWHQGTRRRNADEWASHINRYSWADITEPSENWPRWQRHSSLEQKAGCLCLPVVSYCTNVSFQVLGINVMQVANMNGSQGRECCKQL